MVTPAGRVARRLQDPDVAAWPNLVHLLHYPKNHEAWFDIVLNELDGEWYEERNPINLARSIDVPVYLQIDQGRGWTVDGHIELFDVLKGPRKLDIGSYPPMQSRPWIEEHDKMFRGYDYWLKGIDNGIMDEPAVSVFVEGSREVVTAGTWPPNDVDYPPLYLRPRRKLSAEPERMGTKYAAPDGRPANVSWSPPGSSRPRTASSTTGPRKATPTTRNTRAVPSNRAGSRSTCCASIRSRRRSSRATRWSWSSPTTSRFPTPTTPCCPRTPFTSPSAGPSRTGSTATPHTRPGSCCSS